MKIMTATTINEKSRKDYLRMELKEYMQVNEGMTKSEMNDLCEWVASGNSVYDNPYFCSDDSGRPMDYISAIRFNDEMRAEMAGFLESCSPFNKNWNDVTVEMF